LKEPFQIDTEPHELFTVEPIPAAISPPTANSEPPKTASIVIFESNEQPKPGESEFDEEKEEEPSKTKQTVLLEIVTAECVLIKALTEWRTTFEFVILTKLVKEDPVSSTSETSVSSSLLHWSEVPERITGPSVRLQTLMKVK
jgi:hypothetical protein